VSYSTRGGRARSHTSMAWDRTYAPCDTGKAASCNVGVYCVDICNGPFDKFNQDGMRKLLRRKIALVNENAWLINVLTVKYPGEVSHSSSFYIGLRVHAIGLRVHAVKVALQVSALYLAPKAEMEIPTVWNAVVFV